jgi:hypothetical protein
MKIARTSAVLSGAVAVVLSCTTSAVADPTKGGEFDLRCGSATYPVVVAGNGEWTPAHDTSSTRVFVPTSFGSFSGVVTDENGHVVDSFTEPGFTQKGSGARDAKADVIYCTFTFSEVSDGSDPEFPEGYTFTGSGEVWGFATGRK